MISLSLALAALAYLNAQTDELPCRCGQPRYHATFCAAWRETLRERRRGWERERWEAQRLVSDP